MKKYNFKTIEKKWQKIWEKSQTGRVSEDKKKQAQKEYVLNMFPYPSASGLHVGHVLGWTTSDIFARYKRMKGKYVLYPVGFDAFGLPAENYAIKTKVHPAQTTKTAIQNFTRSLKASGVSCDWTRVISTCEPDYYKWTQWLFLKFYEQGLAYKKKAPVNWCNSCQTVLAREQVVNGKCERCRHEVVQKELEQWFLKITDYAERLLKDIEGLDWPEPIKEAQRNWIGKSEGVLIEFKLKNEAQGIEVFTTRPDTLFGVTYLVIAPEHSLIAELRERAENKKEVTHYIEQSKKKSELERSDLAKEKTGVELKGMKVMNPATGEEVPVWVGDYVIGSYGTGAVMAVPAHDERDYDFSKKYNLPIRQVVRKMNAPIKSYLMGAEEIEDEQLTRLGIKIIEVTKNGNRKIEIPEGSIPSYEELINDKMSPGFWNEYIGSEIVFIFKHKSGRIERIVLTEKTEPRIDKLAAEFNGETWKKTCVWKWLAENSWYTNLIVHTESGILTNSGKFDGTGSEEAKKDIVKEVGGKKKVQFRLRDWLISRQRYWGAPIPMIYCEKCGIVPVPERDLPVVLPKDVNFLPHGESPLTKSKSFHKVACPKCKAKKGVRRESDTMDTFVDSSWYFLRYTDPKNKKEFANQEKIHYWNPVDWYIGGAEHAVLHLLYARFLVKVLKDAGYLKFSEPFLRLRSHGVVLGEDGQKMSKSIGNVVPLDDAIKGYGADTLRMYEVFMGPFEDSKPWSSQGIIGTKRFLERVWAMNDLVLKGGNKKNETRPLLHKSIKKIEEDILAFHFNTCVSQLMILLNDFEKEAPSEKEWEAFLALLAPFAPHITAELWSTRKKKKSIHEALWPAYDAKTLEESTCEVVIQVNGKYRGVVKVPQGAKESEVQKLAEGIDWIKNVLTEEKIKIKKVIFIPNRVLNFVVEEKNSSV